jgi:ABC-type glycerol-3-phosphate transport system permease component
MFPTVGLLIPIYTTFVTLKLTNTYFGLILTHTILTLPFTCWFLKGFFDTIPDSLDEAALIDGCGRISALTRIILPLMKPALVAVLIYIFLMSWDDYLFALTMNTSVERRTLTVGIAISSMGEYGHNWGYIMAASSAAVLPPLIAFTFLQKHMIKGLTMGAVKG